MSDKNTIFYSDINLNKILRKYDVKKLHTVINHSNNTTILWDKEKFKMDKNNSVY